MDLGEELWRDDCPEKYSDDKSGLISTIVSSVIIFVLDLLANIFLYDVDTASALLIASCTTVIFFVIVLFLTSYSNKQNRDNHISVCERGICGYFNCSGKRKNFGLYYSELESAYYHKRSLGKDLITVRAKNKKESVSLRLKSPQKTVDLINDKINSKKFFNR